MAIALLDKLKWNTLPPTDPGFYWIAEAGEQPHIVQVNITSDSHNMVEIMLPGDEITYPVEIWVGALWCGPLKSPEWGDSYGQ